MKSTLFLCLLTLGVLNAFSQTGISVVKHKITDDAYVKIADGQDVYLSVTKEGKVFKFYTSSDGKQWDLVGDFVYHKPESMKIGFYSQAPTGAGCKVEISEITSRKGYSSASALSAIFTHTFNVLRFHQFQWLCFCDGNPILS